MLLGNRTRAILAYLDGRLDDAVSGADEMLGIAEELGTPVMGSRAALVLIWRPLLYMGRGEEALASLGGAADLAGAEDPDADLSGSN
jgi:hypothetical protein